LKQDFHSRTPGDRSAGLSQDASRWTAQIKVCVERRLQSLVQQHEDDLVAINDDRQGSFVRLFSVRDRYACLFESVGMWGEGLRQYIEMANVADAVRQKQPQKNNAFDLPSVGSGLVDTDILSVRAAVAGGAMSTDALTRYLFARKTHFLLHLERPSDVLRGGLQLVRSMGKEQIVASGENQTAPVQRWVMSACWDLIRQTQAHLASTGKGLETHRLATHLDEVTRHMFDHFVDAASERTELVSSVVWTVRRRENKVHDLLWGGPLPCPSGTFSSSAASGEPRVDGLPLHGIINLEEADWIEKSLLSTSTFEAAYLKMVGVRVSCSSIAGRERISNFHMNELIAVAWPKKEFGLILEAMHVSDSPGSHPHWGGLRRTTFAVALCHREVGDLKRYFECLLTLVDDIGGEISSIYKDPSLQQAVANAVADLNSILAGSLDSALGHLSYAFQRCMYAEAVFLDGSSSMKQDQRVTLGIKVNASLVGSISVTSFQAVFLSADDDEETWSYGGPLDCTLAEQETDGVYHLSAEIDLVRSGKFTLKEVNLCWGQAVLRMTPAKPFSIEVTPLKFSLDFFCPVFLVPQSKSTVVCAVTNPYTTPLDITMLLAATRGDVLLDGTARQRLLEQHSELQGIVVASSSCVTFQTKIPPRQSVQLLIPIRSLRDDDEVELEVSVEGGGQVVKSSRATKSSQIVLADALVSSFSRSIGSEEEKYSVVCQFNLRKSKLLKSLDKVEIVDFDLQLNAGGEVLADPNKKGTTLSQVHALSFVTSWPRNCLEFDGSDAAAILTLNLRAHLRWQRSPQSTTPACVSNPEPCCIESKLLVKLPWSTLRSAFPAAADTIDSAAAWISNSPVLCVGVPHRFFFNVRAEKTQQPSRTGTLRYEVSVDTRSWMILSVVSGTINIRSDPHTNKERGTVVCILIPLHSGLVSSPSLELHGACSNEFTVQPRYHNHQLFVNPVGRAVGIL